jgi:hypothetical protein
MADKAAALHAVNQKAVSWNWLTFMQETPVGGVRLSVGTLTVKAEQRTGLQSSNWVVVIVSKGIRTSEAERKAYAEKKSAQLIEARKATERSLSETRDILESEPLATGRERRAFLDSCIKGSAQKTPVVALASLDKINLPSGISRSERNDTWPDIYRSFLLSDTTNKDQAQTEQTRFLNHFRAVANSIPGLHGTLARDTLLQPVLPLGAFKSKVESKRATLIQIDAIEETLGGELDNRKQIPVFAIVTLQYEEQSRTHYCMIFYVLWSERLQRTPETSRPVKN